MLNFVFFTACTCGQRQYSTLFGYSRVKPCEINAVYDAAGTFGAHFCYCITHFKSYQFCVFTSKLDCSRQGLVMANIMRIAFVFQPGTQKNSLYEVLLEVEVQKLKFVRAYCLLVSVRISNRYSYNQPVGIESVPVCS